MKEIYLTQNLKRKVKSNKNFFKFYKKKLFPDIMNTNILSQTRYK